MGSLKSFLATYRKAKVQSNYTAAVTHNLPKGVGSKPGKQKRKAPANIRKPDVDSVINPFLLQDQTASESDIIPAESGESSSINVVTSNQVQQLNIHPQYISLSLHLTSHNNMSTLPIPANVVQDTHPNISLPGASLQPEGSAVSKTIAPHGNVSLVHGHSKATPVQSLAPTLNEPLPVVNASSFQVKFLTGAIKVCAGCRNGYQRGPDGKGLPPPPYDLCLVRKEQHLFYNVASGRQQLSALRNVHYHANLTCPKACCQSFDRSQVQIPDEMRNKVLPEHWFFLLQTYGCV